MSEDLKSIQISEPLLQAIVHEYIDQLRSHKLTAASADRLQTRWESEPVFYDLARRALCQAIVFSSLAVTAARTEDFERETHDLAVIADPDVCALRSEVFKAGIRCAVASIGPEMARSLSVSLRVQMFEQQTLNPSHNPSHNP